LQQLPDDTVELTQGTKSSAGSPFFQMQVWETTARDAGTKNHSERRAFLNILDNTCVKDVESAFDRKEGLKYLPQ
jgi:hypothetical protein